METLSYLEASGSRWLGLQLREDAKRQVLEGSGRVDTLGEVKKEGQEAGDSVPSTYRLWGWRGEGCLSTPETRSWEGWERNTEYIPCVRGAENVVRNFKLQKSHYLRAGGSSMDLEETTKRWVGGETEGERKGRQRMWR